MSLVYNNNKLIGKCETYSIDKVPGTTPFVMLTNFELKKAELNENQQQVLDWLKEEYAKNEELTVFGTLSVFFDETDNHFMSLDVIDALYELTDRQQVEILQAFSAWALEQEEE